MRIAYLGWGSLIREPGNLPLAGGGWQQGGPLLRVEFSRISGGEKRAKCLTLVIDEQNGSLVPTYWAESSLGNLNTAILELQKREGITVVSRVGYINLPAEKTRDYAVEHHPLAVEAIKAWAVSKRFDGVVWTALRSNFEEEEKQPFSVDAGFNYLRKLEVTDRPAFLRALDYFRLAPPETATPLGRAVAQTWPRQ